MAFAVIQAGATLQLFDPTLRTFQTLTLPAGVTLRADVPPRWAVHGQYAILVNTPTQPLTIDAKGIVRLLCPRPPRLAATLAAGSVGTLTGTYGKVRYTFVTYDEDGNTLSESGLSPPSNQVSITNQMLLASNLDLSPDAVSGRRLYRSTTNGAPLFPWINLSGNVLTSVQDDLSDAGLTLVASAPLGTPPDLIHIAEFRDRLWGVGRVTPDDLFYSEAGVMYAWPTANRIPVPRVGSDKRGITALLARRDELGIGRHNRLVKISGTGPSNFRVVTVSENCGVDSQESVDVYRDTAFFIWQDGVYTWDAGALTCISDGTDGPAGAAVRSWFTTDNEFNRSRFKFAFGKVDPVRLVYRLFLASAGSVREDVFIEYDLNAKTWWGPHATAAFAPTCMFNQLSDDDVPFMFIGSAERDLYAEQATRTDSADTPITFDVTMSGNTADAPEYEKYFGELDVVTLPQASGGLRVTGVVGPLAEAGGEDPIETYEDGYDLTQSRQRLGRLGTGKRAQLRFRNDTVGEDVELVGYEVDPVTVLGRR